MNRKTTKKKEFSMFDLQVTDSELSSEDEPETEGKNLPALPVFVKKQSPPQIEKKSSPGRIATVIPILDPNPKYQDDAIEYVNNHLEYSLNDLHLENYSDCLDNKDKSIFASEVIRCMIFSDIYAKGLYYEEVNDQYWSHPDSSGVALTYAASMLEIYRQNPKDMHQRSDTYRLLATEDIAMFLYWSRQVGDIPQYHVVCISDGQNGFLGMIYAQLESWPISKFMKLDDSFEEKLRDRVVNEVRVVGIYGIRSTAAAIIKKQKNVAKSIIFGVVQYAKATRMHMIHVVKNPLGPMRKILRESGFGDKHYLAIHEYNYREPLLLVDMGCATRAILRPLSRWVISQVKEDPWFKLKDFYTK